ncbi:hypothetical protein KCU98_g491, partial [Aureobasidium melanogenum]
MPLQSHLAALVARVRQRRRRSSSPGPDTIASVVVACQQSPPVPGFTKMDRLPDKAIEQIFEYLVDCPHDVTNAMLISTLWRNKLVFSLDDELFHESNTMEFDSEHVEVVFFDDLFVSKYISGNLRHLRVSCVNSLIPLNDASKELVGEVAGAESHADLLLSLADYSPGLETLVIDVHIFDVPQERLAYFFENAVSLNHFELLSPSGRIHVCAGLLRLLTKLPTLQNLRLDHIITRQDAEIMLQSTQWQGQTPFSGLQTLTCHMELGAADILLPHLRALRHFNITLHDKQSPRLSVLTNVFDSIANLTKLETLTVTLPNTTTMLPAQGLMSLASLESIKALRVNSTGLLHCGLSWYELTTLVSHWSDLKKLDWTLRLA